MLQLSSIEHRRMGLVTTIQTFRADKANTQSDPWAHVGLQTAPRPRRRTSRPRPSRQWMGASARGGLRRRRGPPRTRRLHAAARRRRRDRRAAPSAWACLCMECGWTALGSLPHISGLGPRPEGTESRSRAQRDPAERCRIPKHRAWRGQRPGAPRPGLGARIRWAFPWPKASPEACTQGFGAEHMAR